MNRQEKIDEMVDHLNNQQLDNHYYLAEDGLTIIWVTDVDSYVFVKECLDEPADKAYWATPSTLSDVLDELISNEALDAFIEDRV